MSIGIPAQLAASALKMPKTLNASALKLKKEAGGDF
jgi:hypothetical protein